MNKELILYYLPNCVGCHKLMGGKWLEYQKQFLGGLIHFKTIDLSQQSKPLPEFTGGEMHRVPTLVFRDENFFTKIKDPFEMSTQEKTLLEGGALEREIIANIIGGYERWKAEHVAEPAQDFSGGRRYRRRMMGGEYDQSGLQGGETQDASYLKTDSAKDLSGGAAPKSFDIEGGDDLEGGEGELEGGKRRRRKSKVLSRGGTKYRCVRVRKSKSPCRRRRSKSPCRRRRSRSRCSKRRGSFGKKVKAYMARHPESSLPEAAKALSKGRK